MKAFKTIMGIILFWVILLLGGGLIAFAASALNLLSPGPLLSSRTLVQLLCSPAAAIIALVVLLNTAGKNDKILITNVCIAFPVLAALCVFIYKSGAWTWPLLIGDIVAAGIYGYAAIAMVIAVKKEKSPGADNTEG